MITAVLLCVLTLCCSTAGLANDLLQPGGALNPIVVLPEPTLPGLPPEAVICPRVPTATPRDFAPGGYFNPYRLEQQPDGSIEIHSPLIGLPGQLPEWEGERWR